LNEINWALVVSLLTPINRNVLFILSSWAYICYIRFVLSWL